MTTKLTNYIAFVNPETGYDQIGHLDLENDTIIPLSFASGTPVRNLYQVIEAGSQTLSPAFPIEDKKKKAVVIIAAGSPINASSVKILPPISGRDVLAVGKNYMEHAKEFNSSGYDSSDKVDRPSDPVIFTKRATSIIAHGEEILSHEEGGFTSSADYEGEIGVVLGRTGFRVKEEDAWDYVWGFTIINDVTARERQRDHKQFYIGKSADTYCPIGPIAVPKEDLPKTLRVQTHVNGELRQDSTSDELIFSIPELIAAMSAGQTLQPGDVIATGTPAGVGIGRKPPVFLKPGDEISISVTGLGTLTNRVAQPGATNTTIARVAERSAFELTNGAKTAAKGARDNLLRVNGKLISYKRIDIPGTDGDDEAENEDKSPIIFVHGLGGTKDYWRPLISHLSCSASVSSKSRNYHIYDLEGHGLSPTHPLSTLIVSSLAADLFEIAVKHAGATPSNPATIIAHGVGSLVAMRFAQDCPSLVRKLVLMGPPALSLPRSFVDISVSLSLSEPLRSELVLRAALARREGMEAIAGEVVNEVPDPADDLSYNTFLVATARRLSLLSQDPEGYAKACQAFASADSLDFAVNKETKVLIITGLRDRISPVQFCVGLKDSINYLNGYTTENQEEEGNARVVAKNDVGHWHVFEDPMGVSKILEDFLG